jgi:hypothetical protein
VTINSDVGIRESIEDEEEAAVIKFENGETIFHLPAIYAPAIEDVKQACTTVHSITAGSAVGGSTLLLIAVGITIFFCYRCKRGNMNTTAPRMDIVMTEKEKALTPEERRMQEFPYHQRSYPQMQIGYAGLSDCSYISPSPDQWLAHIENLRAAGFLGADVTESNPGPAVNAETRINFRFR